MSKVSWYRVKVSRYGVQSAEPVSCRGTDDEHVYYVEAHSASYAISIAQQLYNEYSNRKVAARRKKLKTEGRCRCGRTQDRDGEMCSVCLERNAQWRRRHQGRRATTGKPRDEKARVEKNLQRQRDRRAELRLEVLIEIRDRFVRNPRTFLTWVRTEIEQVTAPSRKGAA